MKRFYLFLALLAGTVFSAHAQDLIVLRDGVMIEAKVTEISPTEIRYKRFDNLDGPTIVIPAANVLSIRYENGTSEIFNPVTGTEQASDTEQVAEQVTKQTKMPANTAMARDKFIFGINANLGGAISYVWDSGAGPSLSFEFGRGNFNSEINLMFPLYGFGVLATFNGFWPSRVGGAYFGGGVGVSFSVDFLSLTAGINAGYKFVTKSGFYFRTGTFAGFDFGFMFDGIFPVYIKPDLAIGWTMR